MSESSKYTSAGEYLKALKAGKSALRFVLVAGRNATTAEDILAQTVSFLQKAEPDTEIIHMHGFDAKEEYLHGNLCTPPIFQPQRLVFVRHADVLLKRIDQNPTVAAYFVRDLQSLPDSIWAIFQLDDGKLPASLNFLEKAATFFPEEDLKEQDLPLFLLERAESLSFVTSLETMKILCEKCAFDANACIRALDRVIVYCLNQHKIDKSDVEEILYELEGDFNFKILDALADRDIDTCMRQIQQHKFSDGVQLTFSWIRLFTDVWRYNAWRRAGVSEAEMAKQTGMSSGQAFYFKKRATLVNLRFTTKELDRILIKLTKLDIQIKTETRSDAQTTILMMFLESLRQGNTSAIL
ncbi:MAG: hypothetical protein KDK38_14055 [Leptospiraceae bacterium]|nr:hypothetical protein [Leptospiraceae bacterium]